MVHTVSVDEWTIKNARQQGTDVVEATYFCGCCSECAKYRGRWFSISGKDRRFPKAPVYRCSCQGLSFHPVFYGISKPLYYSEGQIISVSNRPFVDDRTEAEKTAYDFYRKEQEITAWYEPYRIRLLPYQHRSEEEYRGICENLPEMAPKSLSGYNRMKNSNSNNFQKLADEAAKRGYRIRLTPEEKQELQYLRDCRSKYNHVIGECMAFRNSFRR